MPIRSLSGMWIIARIISIITVVILGAGVPVSPTTSTTRTAEQEAMIEQAYSRFALAGIELPDVEILFHLEYARETQNAACYGYRGAYEPSAQRIRLCDPSNSTLVHELAHAWIETTFDEVAKQAFLDLRQLDHWTGAEEWRDRGAEQAAEIITWGLMERDIASRWVRTDEHGKEVEDRRLQRLGEVYFDDLVAAYLLMTGEVPVNRINGDPNAAAATSPEARRAG